MDDKLVRLLVESGGSLETCHVGTMSEFGHSEAVQRGRGRSVNMGVLALG
jgi:hypothetical protein